MAEYGRLTTEIVHGLKHLFNADGFPRMTHFLNNAIYALMTLKLNLAALPRLFAKTPSGEQLRRTLLPSLKNAAVLRFWQEEFPLHTAESYQPLVNRLSALLLDDRTYRTFAQNQNAIDFDAIIDGDKILIVAPPASVDAASIVGGCIIAQLQHTAFRRVGTPRSQHHFHLIIDEHQRFATSAKTLESTINESAKAGYSLSLANQETGQLPTELLKALYSIPNIFVFGVNMLDAKTLAHLFNGKVLPETLASLPTGHVYARIDTEIVNFQAFPPVTHRDQERAKAIIAYSKEHYYATTNEEPVQRTTRRRRSIAAFPEEN